jgi:hypothetical protein
MEPTVDAHHRTRLEGPQVQRGEVQLVSSLGVGGQQDLEAAVESEAVDHVGAHPPADAVTGLEHRHVDASPVQRDGAREAGQAGADHDHFGIHVVGSSVRSVTTCRPATPGGPVRRLL